MTTSTIGAGAAGARTLEHGTPTAPIRILVSDKVSPECLAVLDAEAKGPVAIEVDYKHGLKPEELVAIIDGYDGLIIRSATKVTAAVIERATRLKAVVRAGVGVDNVDLGAATSRGIVVMNCPAGNTVAAAEHTIALLCATARLVPQAHMALKAGKWERTLLGTEIAGKTLAVVGLGKVGREVAKRGRGLGMRVIGFDPFVAPEAAQALDVEVVTLEACIQQADFLTVHVPMTEKTKGLIGTAAFAAMKKGVRILNTARGGVIDEAALAEAVKSGKVAGAGIDVFEEEPCSKDHPFLKLDNIVVTPHLGASTVEAQEAVGIASAKQLVACLRDGIIENAVNTVALDKSVLEQTRPWAALATKLGSFQAQLREGAVRRVTIRYAGEAFEGETKKLLKLAFLQGFLRHYTDSPVNYVNASLFAKQHGVDVTEETTTKAEGYVHLVTTEVETIDPATQATKVRRLAGTVFGEKMLRIVRLDGYTTDAAPEGAMLLVSNDDRPGIIGLIGTTLGAAGVNIASMSVGRDTTGGTAVAILNVDSAVPEAVSADLAARKGVLWVRTLKL